MKMLMLKLRMLNIGRWEASLYRELSQKIHPDILMLLELPHAPRSGVPQYPP
jgi:hypothetical protein